MHQPPLTIITSTILSVNPVTHEMCTLRDQTIEISPATGRITNVRPHSITDMKQTEMSLKIDLRGKTVMPGFIDTHVHLFLHSYREASWLDQVTRESTTERVIRAVKHAETTLRAGFTAVRDLGTEGAEDSDVALRKCISSPLRLVPGPRYFCASRAIVSTGSYGKTNLMSFMKQASDAVIGPKNEQRPFLTSVDGKTGADVADGIDECVKAVRRQIGTGADWIKIYADYPARALATTSPTVAATSLPTFTEVEVSAMIQAAHRLNVKVAAHCHHPDTIRMLAHAGVDSIEHGTRITEDVLPLLVEKKVSWNPTFAAYHFTGGSSSQKWDAIRPVFLKAIELGVRISIGGDTGVFPHGENAMEMKLMKRLGMVWQDVIKAATWSAWLCIRPTFWDTKQGQEELERYSTGNWENVTMGDNEVALGSISAGFAADIVATDGDLENDFERAISPDHIVFVMKAGVVYKIDGNSYC